MVFWLDIEEKNKTSRAGQMTIGPGHSYVDPKLSYTNIYSIHPFDIQYPPYSISLRGVLQRGAVSTIFKVFGM